MSGGDHGIKYFSYGILPHKGGLGALSVIRPAYRFNYAPARSAVCDSPVREIVGDGIIVESVRRGEAGIVVRLYECERSAAEGTLVLSREFEAAECNFLEEDERPLGRVRILTLAFRPFEIKTVLLRD